MERLAKRVRAKGNYWNELQERAVLQYQNERDPIVRNEIFNTHLYPQLRAMSVTILRRYYKSNDESFALDSITHLVEKVIDKFDPSKGRSYSYFQTVIKHYLYDVLNRSPAAKEKAGRFSSLDDFGDDDIMPNELVYSDESFTEDDYRDSVLQRLQLLKGQGLKRKTSLMIDVLIDLLNRDKMYSKEYVSLYLFIAFKSDCTATLRNHAKHLGIQLRFASLEGINRKLVLYADEHGFRFSGHDLKTIEPWQELALSSIIPAEELALESI